MGQIDEVSNGHAQRHAYIAIFFKKILVCLGLSFGKVKN